MALGVLGLCLFLAIYFGGRWAVQHYLAREWQAGPGAFRVFAPDFRWSLDLAADSAWYRNPTAEVRVSRIRLSADLFRSLVRFAPSARLEAESVFVRLRPGPDTVKPRPDSIPFPDFKLPLAAVVRIGWIETRMEGDSADPARGMAADTAVATAADSATASNRAPLVLAEGVELNTRGERAATLSIASLKAGATGSLVHRMRAAVDWGAGDSLLAGAGWGCGTDSASLEARLPKANLLFFSARARARLAASRPYARAFGLADDLPRAEAIALDADLARGRALTAKLELGLRAAGLPRTLPIGLPDQAVTLRCEFSGHQGKWSLRARGRGAEGTEVDLKGGLSTAAAPEDSLAEPAFLARHAQVTLEGRVRGFRVRTGGKDLPADLDVREARLAPDAVRASLSTGDGSRIEVDLRRTATEKTRTPKSKPRMASGSRRAGSGKAQAAPAGLPPWDGTFSVDLAPRETWMLAFTDTNLAFARARLAGEVRHGEAKARLDARALRAYGVLADSLSAPIRFARGAYSVAGARLWRGRGAPWDLSARVEPGRPGPPASVTLSHPEAGSVEASQAGAGKLALHARNLAPDRLPYRGLESLDAYGPRVTADFAWDRLAKTGSAELSAAGSYRKEPAAVGVRAEWDAERLDLKEARASLSGNAIAASARLRLHGRQFFELKGLVPADVEDASLKADRFDLAKALAAFLPQPPLRSGRIDGDLGYGGGGGFRGTWRITGLTLAGEERAFAFKEVAIEGRGDTALIRAVTVSETEPLFRDSVGVALTGLLGQAQRLSIRARAGQDITLAFDGGLKGFRDLEGRLSLHGGVELPGASGKLSGVRVVADLALPLKEGLKGLRLNADTLRAVYAVAGLDTQAISATVRMRGGQVEVPSLVSTGRDGAELRGRLAFDPDSRRMNADLQGARFSGQFGGDKIQLRELAARFEMDSTQMVAHVAVGSGSAEHAKASLRAAGDFSRLSAYYRAPLGPKAGQPGGILPLVRLSVVLDSSNVRYRLRNSLEGLLGVFRKQGQRKAASRRAKPMQVDINVETAGRGNSFESDVMRFAYVGNVSMIGTYPYALMRGRLTSVSGGIGTKKQAYTIKSMEIKWLNAPLEEGELDLNAEKRLARTCEPGEIDSCAIRMNLTGLLSEVKFAYDSDCRGGYGSGGADVSAMVFSVRRGCYSPLASTGSGGLTYQEQVLGMLDPFASGYLSEGLGKLSGNWIQSAQVTGISSLAQDRKAARDSTREPAGASTREAIGVEIMSKEFWRVRFRAKSAYNLQYADQFNPWSYRVGVEWRAPVFRMVADPVWKSRIKNRITVDASVFTDPSHPTQTDNGDALRRRLGLNYDYDWWGHWWAKRPAARDTAGAKAIPVPDPLK